MNRPITTAREREGAVLARVPVTALVLALVAVLAVVWVAPRAGAQTSGSARTLTDAEFRWGINQESSGRTFDPTAVNLMTAGELPRTSKTRIVESEWRNRAGNVTIEKRTANGAVAPATWAGTLTDTTGSKPTTTAVGSYSGLEMVFRGGTGTVDPDTGTATISWTGTVTVLYYSGDSIFTLSDPVLTVTPSSARVTATLGGYKSSQTSNDWVALPDARNAEIAVLPRNQIELDSETGISVKPRYEGVTYSGGNQQNNGQYFGSFPADFVDFVSEMGIGDYWYSSGGLTDPKKIPLPITVSWDSNSSAAPICSGGTTADGTSCSGSNGLLKEVIQDSVEDIIRAAGTDVSDTAAAWMDEAWKPLQPGAVNAARDAAAAAAAPGGPADAEIRADQPVVDEQFAGYFEEVYAPGAPITAGTVGSALASIPASSGAAASVGVPGTASQTTVTDQGAVQLASAPLDADVVYAQTSASSKAGDPALQWQWGVGMALLALAAALFYQTVRRKD